MRTLVLVVLIGMAQQCLGAGRDMNQIFLDTFGKPNGTNYATKAPVTEDTTKCGLTSPSLRILNGAGTLYTEFPWMVALFTKQPGFSACAITNDNCWIYACGGSLISLHVVLTAAHNVIGKQQDELKARAGDWDLDSKNETYPNQESLTKRIIMHYRYVETDDPLKLEYDIALLVLKTPFRKADNIGLICLPPPDLDVSSAKCKTAGWGKTRLRSRRRYEKVLKVVNVDYVEHASCQRSLSTALRTNFALHDSFTCAGGIAGIDACTGDGGSPLMCLTDDDYYYQRGIVSWGIDCGQPDVPGVYTDVVKVRNWVDDQMRVNGFNPKTYIYVPEDR